MEGTVEVKDGYRRWSLSLCLSLPGKAAIISTYAHGLVGQKPEKEDRFYALSSSEIFQIPLFSFIAYPRISQHAVQFT